MKFSKQKLIKLKNGYEKLKERRIGKIPLVFCANPTTATDGINKTILQKMSTIIRSNFCYKAIACTT